MFTGNENHDISLQDAATLTQNFRSSQAGNQNVIKGEFFGKDALIALLSQPECVGARIYYGLDTDNIPRLVIVGAIACGDDMIDGVIMEKGAVCPPSSSAPNDLNC
ncbi:MAG: hypothetical protein WCO54_05325 [Bacteroidota bacterium]